jgi:hypothetical protein
MNQLLPLFFVPFIFTVLLDVGWFDAWVMKLNRHSLVV